MISRVSGQLITITVVLYHRITQAYSGVQYCWYKSLCSEPVRGRVKRQCVDEVVMNERSGWIVRQRGCVNVSACSGLSDGYRIKIEGSLCVYLCDWLLCQGSAGLHKVVTWAKNIVPLYIEFTSTDLPSESYEGICAWFIILSKSEGIWSRLMNRLTVCGNKPPTHSLIYISCAYHTPQFTWNTLIYAGVVMVSKKTNPSYKKNPIMHN